MDITLFDIRHRSFHHPRVQSTFSGTVILGINKDWDWSDRILRFVRVPYFLYIEDLYNLSLPYEAEGAVVAQWQATWWIELKALDYGRFRDVPFRRLSVPSGSALSFG
jgi:hypothetical protein